MSILRTTVTALAALSFVAPGAALAQTVDNYGRTSLNVLSGYATIGGVIMKRSTPEGSAFIAANPAGTPFVSPSAFKFGWDGGVDGTFGLRFGGRDALEFRFLRTDSGARLNFTSPGAFIGVGFTGPGGTQFASSYDTYLSSWELNWRHQWTDQIALLVGARVINLDDSLDTSLNGNVARGLYAYRNRLTGGQIGIDWSVLPMNNPFQINLVGKVGLFGLHSAGGISEFQGVNFIGGFGTERGGEHVMAGEVGVSVGYRILPNVMLRAGYQLLYINDIALASNAAGASLLNPSLLSNNIYRDSILFHGANFGVTINW